MARTTWSRALVTGASSGIGEAFVRSLAAGGTAVVAVARREGRLTALADDLHRQFGATVEPLPADLADPGQRTTVERRLASDDQPIDLLINNAGIGAVGPFLSIEPERIDEQIAVNVTAVVHLAHAAVVAMRPRGRGTVINVSSLASLQPLPKHAVYAATKAFVTSFSESLTEELRGSGVTVTAVLPGFIRTEFIGMAKAETQAGRLPDFLWMSAEQVAEAGLTAAARGDPMCVPGAGYKAFAVASAPFPRSLKRWVSGLLTRDG